MSGSGPHQVVDVGETSHDDRVRVAFARACGRHVACPDDAVAGTTVGEVPAAYFAANPAALVRHGRRRGTTTDRTGSPGEPGPGAVVTITG